MPSPKMFGKASASAPGACGELWQGILNGIQCMVTCPIDMYSVATVEIREGNGGASGPEDSPKAVKSVRETLCYLDETKVSARLSLDSHLPRGKGMASSTADVAASIGATASALGQDLSPPQIASIALRVEPTDGIMYPDIALFDHLEGRIARILGQPPPMWVIVLDFGGSVDTLEFNKDRSPARLELEVEDAAAALIEDGIRLGDPILIGRGATQSAIANQRLLFNPYLDAVLALSGRANSIGVNVAHSGAVLGMLFPDDQEAVKRAAALALHELPDLKSAQCCRIVSGGVRQVK